MTEVQKRVLVMCEINFYEASVSPSAFRSSLKSLGWKEDPDFSKADLAMLTRLAKALRSKLRTAAI